MPRGLLFCWTHLLSLSFGELKVGLLLFVSTNFNQMKALLVLHVFSWLQSLLFQHLKGVKQIGVSGSQKTCLCHGIIWNCKICTEADSWTQHFLNEPKWDLFSSLYYNHYLLVILSFPYFYVLLYLADWQQSGGCWVVRESSWFDILTFKLTVKCIDKLWLFKCLNGLH